MRQTVEAACAAQTPLSSTRTTDEKKRNRHETRTVSVFDLSAALTGTQWQALAVAAIAVERRVHHFLPETGGWKTSSEISFYLSSHPIEARLAAQAIRFHWHIENKSHHTRDVTFREDASRIRKNPGVLARVRSFAYNILRFNQSGTIAQDRFANALGGINALASMRFCGQH